MPAASVDPLARRVAGLVRRHRLARPGDHVVVGLSGGPDSVALLHLFGDLQGCGFARLRLSACHLHHRIRGASADADQAFCRRLCRDLGVPFVTAARDVPALARAEGLSLETAAREARLGFFAQAARSLAAQAVAVGHTLDDQAETVLMRIVRGAGLRGLRGMPLRRPLAPGGPLRLVRPLLATRRREILAYLERRGATWRLDETNAELGPMRNRVRGLILPGLRETLGRDPTLPLARLALLASQSQRVLARLGREAFRRCACGGDGAAEGVRLRRDRLLALEPALRYEVLRIALAGLGAPPPSHREARLLARALRRNGGLPTSLRGGFRIEDAGPGRLWIRRVAAPPSPPPSPPPAPPPAVRLPVPGAALAPGLGYRVRAEVLEVDAPWSPEAPGGLGPKALGEAFAAEGVAFPLAVRPWRAGDRIRIGRAGRKKLQDLFVDAKIPRGERSRIPVVEDGAGRILWVVGVRRDGATFVSDSTRRVLLLHADPTEAAPAGAVPLRARSPGRGPQRAQRR